MKKLKAVTEFLIAAASVLAAIAKIITLVM
jgi:hypothetical protein